MTMERKKMETEMKMKRGGIGASGVGF